LYNFAYWFLAYGLLLPRSRRYAKAQESDQRYASAPKDTIDDLGIISTK
jgi:hypothetical protein